MRMTGLTGVLGAVLLAVPVVAASQDTADAPNALQQALPDDPQAVVCLRGAWRDVPQVAQDKRGQSYMIYALAGNAPALLESGFTVTPCPDAAGRSTAVGTLTAARGDSSSSEGPAAWRDEICEMASFGNDAIQLQFAKALGESPAVLCAHAEMVAGPWERSAVVERSESGEAAQ